MFRRRSTPLAAFLGLFLVVGDVLLTPGTLTAAVFFSRTELPADWPESVRVLWKDSLTIDVAHGISERQYEIRLDDRGTFENVWPDIVSLKDTGGSITLVTVGSSSDSRSGSTMEGPGVRIRGPVGPGRARLRDGSWGEFGPEFPDYLKSADGVLPEYATIDQDSSTNGTVVWKEWEGEIKGFRARTDLTLVVDGDIVDLNRIKLPTDTPIMDMREFGAPAED